jgi:sulfate permease, SulP family
MHEPSVSFQTGLRSYDQAWLRSDVVAGLTTAAVVVPKSMAYAEIAGLPAEAGLYAALAPMLLYACIGSSRVLSVSTTSTIAILSATALSQVARTAGPAELLTATVTLSLLVGAMLLVAGMLRLGFLASFISDPVLTGFKAGIGVLILVDQLPKLLGLHLDKSGFFRDLLQLAQLLPNSSTFTVALALVTLALLFALEKYAPRLPAPLLAVVLGIAASAFFGFADLGIDTVGEIRAGLPSVHLPDLTLVSMLWPAALGIALMSFTETIATGRAFTSHGERRPIANRELIALGVANLGGSLTGAMPAGGGASQTSVNARAGAKTQIAGVVTACVVLAVVLVLATLISLLPLATLAAVVVATTMPLLSPREFRAIGAIRREELYWALVALVGVVLFGSLSGILIAVVASVLTLFYHANRPPVYALARDQAPGVLVLRTEGRLYFANAQRTGDKMWQLIHEAKPRVVIFDCGAIPDVEYTALRMLTDAEEKLSAAGTTLCLAALNPTVSRVIEAAPLGKTLGHERIFATVDQALESCTARTVHAQPR